VDDTQDKRHRRYAAKALQGQCDTVSAGGKGSRDADLNAAAFAVGQLLHNFPLSESEATAALLDAIGPHLDRGQGDQGERWARRKIARGLNGGAGQPRPPLDPNYTPPRLASEAPRARTPIPEPPPDYPPLDTVKALWEASLPVDTSADMSTWEHDPTAWITSRGIDVDAVATGNLARMLPDGLELPTWAMMGRRDWREAGYRLIVPMYDAAGEVRSIRARQTQGSSEPGRKSTAAKYKGCAMANPHALELLRGQGEPSTVVIAEGEPDYLTDATAWPTHPVFGIATGSWKPEHAQRIPDGSTVVIRTDTDKPGNDYAETIRKTFEGRNVKLLRKSAVLDDDGKHMDENDLLQEGKLPADPTEECEDMETTQTPLDDAGTDESTKDRVQPVAEVFETAWKSLKARADGLEKPVTTPWKRLNDHLGGGFLPGELIPVVGNPGSGKTQWAVHVAWHNAKAGRPVYYVALESNPADMVSRLMGLEYAERTGKRVVWSDDLYRARKPELLADVAARTSEAIKKLPLSFIFGEPLRWHPSELEEALERHKQAGEQPLVIVDFLQLVGPEPDNGRSDTRERISSAAYYLRTMANDYKATVIAISATARSNYPLFNDTSKSGPKDTTSAFRIGKGNAKTLEGMGKEAGEIEYAAATVLALCRKWYGKNETPTPLWVAVVKARFGETGWPGKWPLDGTGLGEMQGPDEEEKSQAKPKAKTSGGGVDDEIR